MLGAGFSERYEIKDRIGQGGMGEVYRAFDRTTNRDVTIKTLLDFRDAAALEQFRHECRVLASLNHSNIVDIYDIGEHQGRPYFVMPLLPGKTLGEVLQNENLPPGRVIDIICQSCRGLQAAHGKGLIHRDLKPSNIFVLPGDSVKLIDFGVAGVMDTRSTMKLKGTLLYMSPEQTELRPLTPRSDLFSLAVVTYEALAGRRPFEGTNAEQIIRAIRTELQPPISEIRPEVSESISQVVHKALAKQPSLRFSSVQEFADCLQKALHGQPIEIFDEGRIQSRLERARQAVDTGDFELASDIVSTVEAETYHPEVVRLRRKIDKSVREGKVRKHLASARQRFDVEEDELALERVQAVLELDASNPEALGLKAEIENRSRRRQIDRWVALARQHLDNHAFSHAREALDKALELDATHTEGLTLLADLERSEQDYKRIQREKSQLYQGALDAIEKGELSAALTRLEKVIEFDAIAPDTLAGEREKLYERVRSEHREVNEAYEEARTHRSEKKFREALEICDRMLAKYPGHALYSSLKLDLEADESQALSAYIAEIDQKVASEPDLEAQAKLLEQACERFPQEHRFQQRLKTVKSKSDLVKSIVLRARGYEASEKFQDAQVQWQTLRTVYPEYPGLDYEVERLEKRIDLQAQEDAKARWVDRIEQARGGGQWDGAERLVAEALEEFPEEKEFLELEQIVREGSKRAAEAHELLTEARGLIEDPADVQKGIERLRQAYQFDPRNLVISNTLYDTLVKHAQRLVDKDWKSAEPFAKEAKTIKPSDNVVSGLISLIDDRKRSESVDQIVSEARQQERAGEFETAIRTVRKALDRYPGEQRLRRLESTLAESVGASKSSPPREPFGGPGPAGDETVLMADAGQRPPDAGDETVVQPLKRAGGPKKPKPQKKQKAKPAKGDPKKPKAAKPVWIAAAAALALGAGISAVAWFALRGGSAPETPAAVSYAVSSIPAGATVRVDGRDVGLTPADVDLEPGEYRLDVALIGYASISRTVVIGPEAATSFDAALEPLPVNLRIVSDLDQSELTINGEPAAEGGEAPEVVQLDPGAHEVSLTSGRASVRFAFESDPGDMPRLAETPATTNLRAVAIGSLGDRAIIYAPDGVRAIVDGEERGVVANGSLELASLQPGVRELTLEEGSTSRTLLFEADATPSLAVFLSSDRDVGDLYISANETDVQVLIDGRRRSSSVRNGRIRVYNVPTGARRIRIVKDGYRVEPAEVSLAVNKGQIANAEFRLEKIPQIASLEISGAVAGTEVFLDGQTIGRVGADGTLQKGDVTPGRHRIELRRKGFRVKSIDQQFGSEAQIKLGAEQTGLELAEGVLAFTVTPAGAALDVDPAIIDAGAFQGQKKYEPIPTRVELQTGTYNLQVSAPGYEPWAANLQLADREVKNITVNLDRTQPGVQAQRSQVSSADPMDRWEDGADWEEKDGWYVRRGAAFVPYAADASRGTFSFTTKLPSPLMGGGRPTSWAVGYTDRANYLLFELNKGKYTKSIVLGGRTDQVEERDHGLDSKQDQKVEVVVAPGKVTIRVGGKTLDEWSIEGAGEGRFAFVVPAGKDLEIKDFSYRP